MSKTGIIALSLFVAVLIFGGSFAGCVLGFRSDCIHQENGIVAQYDQDRNNYDNMWKKFREMSQVNAQYADDMKKVFDSAIQGRYGADGSKAMFQFIKEHNPQLDSATYVKLQAAIEAGRNSFEADQKQLLDRKREYKDLLGSTRALAANIFLGFPRIDMNKYDIVTSGRTEKAFEDKKDDEIKLR